MMQLLNLEQTYVITSSNATVRGKFLGLHWNDAANEIILLFVNLEDNSTVEVKTSDCHWSIEKD